MLLLKLKIRSQGSGVKFYESCAVRLCTTPQNHTDLTLCVFRHSQSEKGPKKRLTRNVDGTPSAIPISAEAKDIPKVNTHVR